MTMIRVTEAGTIWPYSLGQLRQDEPTKSFSSAPSDADLALFGVFRVVATAQPEIDPAAEKVIEVVPAEQDGQWVQQWEVIELSDAEKEAYYRATHPPQWIAFNAALPADVNTLLAQAQQLNRHDLYLRLGVGLGKAADGDDRVFLGAWQQARAGGLISAELVTHVQMLATQYDLPAAFVAGLGAAPWQWPESPTRFQRWDAPDGSEWVYDQPRAADGTYMADDPATPESESALDWLPAGGEA